jgi:hypothetical protein
MSQTEAQIENISGQVFTFSQGNLPTGLYYGHLRQVNKFLAKK